MICCVFLVVCGLLFVVCWVLFGYALFVVWCMLLCGCSFLDFCDVCCLLSVVSHSNRAVSCYLLVARPPLPVVR